MGAANPLNQIPLDVKPRILVSGLLAGCIAFAGCAGDGADAVFAPSQAVPEWVADAVFYQIFPERFRNGDPSNDPTLASIDEPHTVPVTWRIGRWTADWYARYDWEVATGDDFYATVRRRRYGGDLAGVIEKLDYLADLGVTAIYFNPLFYARSMHKYDGNTYHHIDPFFGPDPEGDLEMMALETADPGTWEWTAADRLFLDLISEARSRGIRIVIDGVWNHTGRDFFAFADVRKNGPDSQYKDWYIILSFDDPSTPEDEFDHQGWWGHKPLPEFADTPDGKDLHPGPKQYVFDCTRRWMDPNGDGDPSDGIAGWRLDVVPDMPIGFWADWNAYVRTINPEAYTVAEIWHDAARDVERGGFSGTMSYHAFAMPVKGFLVDDMMPADRFARLITERAEVYGPRYRFGLLNLVDSHDTPRIATMIVNRETAYTEPDVFDYDRDGWGGRPDYDVRKPNDIERRIQKMIALLQASHLGAPMIYYGTESGMWGADDPDDRMPMVWDDLTYDVQENHPMGLERSRDSVAFDEDLHRFYRDVFRLRREREVLRRGSVELAAADSDRKIVAFRRALGETQAFVVLNRSVASQRLALPAPDSWTGAAIAFSTAPDEVLGVEVAGESLVVELPGLAGAVVEGHP